MAKANVNTIFFNLYLLLLFFLIVSMAADAKLFDSKLISFNSTIIDYYIHIYIYICFYTHVRTHFEPCYYSTKV